MAKSVTPNGNSVLPKKRPDIGRGGVNQPIGTPPKMNSTRPFADKKGK